MKLEKRVPDPGDHCAPPSLAHSLLQQLSPLRIANMTDSEVCEVLPRLVLALQQEGLSRRRPDWWPSSIPWTLQASPSNTFKSNSSTILRRALLLCHSHLPQHAIKPVPAAQPRILDWLNSQPPSRSAKAAMGASSPQLKGSSVPYLEIYLCYMCNEEFDSKDTLQKHQVQCGGSTLSLSIPSTPPASDAPSPCHFTMASDDTSSSGGTTTCTSLPSSRSSLRPQQSRDAPPRAPGAARSRVRETPPSFAVAYHDFVVALDLVPAFRAKKIRLAQRRNTECETIDLEEPQTPISPSTPRTPKLLISQLSRDASACGTGGDGHHSSRRRLSYLRQSSEKKTEKPDGGEGGSNCESDSESCSTSSDDAEPKVHKKSLLNIDLSSGLGQRVMKHIKSEAHVPVITDSEQFCRTPIKDKYQDRLRARQSSYPITYKLTRNRLRQHVHCHTFKFTRQDKREFMAKMRTGLNRECRQLLKSVRKCSVVIKRLSRKTLIKWKPSLNKLSVSLKPLTAGEIVHWTRPKPPSPVDASPCIFPLGPTFLFADIDRVLGLKRKDVQVLGTSCKLLPSHFVSEADNAELQQQKLTVYRSLLTDLSTATLSDPEDEAETCSQRERRDGDKVPRGQYGDKFPSLFSILSGETVTKRPGRVRQAAEKAPVNPLMHVASGSVNSMHVASGSVNSMHVASCSVNSMSDCMQKGVKCMDFKQPLKIEIPSPTVPLSAASQSSLLDDVISIRTTTSSDEESNRGGVCCSMCATRDKCVCSPRKSSSMSSASLCSLQSPDPALPPYRTPPLPSLLLSSGLTSKSSLSSHPTLSPPVLSPVSQLSHSPSLPSPRLTRASFSHSPASQLTSRSARLAPESPISRPKRQQDCGPTGAAKSSTRYQRTSFGVCDNGNVSSSQRPSTRSNHKDNPTNTSVLTADVGQHNRSASFSVLQSGDPKPTSLHSSTSLGTINEQEAVMLGMERRATRSGRVIGDMPQVSDFSLSHPQKWRSGSRSGSRSSDRSSVNDSASLDSVMLVGSVRMLRSAGSLSPRSDKSTSSMRGQTRADRAGNSVKSESSASIHESRSVGSQNPLLHAAIGAVNGISDSMHKGNNSKSVEGGRHGIRTSARNHVSPVNGHEAASRSGGISKDMKQDNVVEEIHGAMPLQVLGDTGVSVPQADNPFLLSKAQTSLFSSSIREQARRHWHGSHKSPDRGGVAAKAVLRSGNSFRMASAGCISPGATSNTSHDMWPGGAVKTEALISPRLYSPTMGSHNGRASAPSTPPQQVSPDTCQPLSPVRKRLSPLQMLSVLESAKSQQPSGKSGASGKRKAAAQRQARSRSTGVTSKIAAYQTRTKETEGPVKKMRLTGRVE